MRAVFKKEVEQVYPPVQQPDVRLRETLVALFLLRLQGKERKPRS